MRGCGWVRVRNEREKAPKRTLLLPTEERAHRFSKCQSWGKINIACSAGIVFADRTLCEFADTAAAAATSMEFQKWSVWAKCFFPPTIRAWECVRAVGWLLFSPRVYIHCESKERFFILQILLPSPFLLIVGPRVKAAWLIVAIFQTRTVSSHLTLDPIPGSCGIVWRQMIALLGQN